jgi:hypothetical protein
VAVGDLRLIKPRIPTPLISDNDRMATLASPPLPPSLKDWTTKDRQLNQFAIRSYRDVADADYIAARLAYRAQLPVQFLWASQQALEKYLKFILFLERVKVEKLGHNLAPPLNAIEDAGLVLDLTKGTQKFIREIDRVGRFRYMEVSFVVWWHWILSLDRAVWELRRFCTSDPRPRSLKLVDGEIAPRYRIDSGYLEKVLNDKQNSAREYLLWHNGFVGKKRRKVTVRGTFIAVNSPLFNQPELVDALAGLAFIPRDVAKAYRALAGERKNRP